MKVAIGRENADFMKGVSSRVLHSKTLRAALGDGGTVEKLWQIQDGAGLYMHAPSESCFEQPA